MCKCIRSVGCCYGDLLSRSTVEAAYFILGLHFCCWQTAEKTNRFLLSGHLSSASSTEFLTSKHQDVTRWRIIVVSLCLNEKMFCHRVNGKYLPTPLSPFSRKLSAKFHFLLSLPAGSREHPCSQPRVVRWDTSSKVTCFKSMFQLILVSSLNSVTNSRVEQNPPHCTCAGPNVLSASDVAWRQPQEWASADGIDAVTHSRGVLRSFGEVRKLRNNLLRTGLARPTLKRQTRKWGGFIPWISVWCWPLIYEVPLQYVAACYTIEASSVFQMGVLVPLGFSHVPKRVHH